MIDVFIAHHVRTPSIFKTTPAPLIVIIVLAVVVIFQILNEERWEI